MGNSAQQIIMKIIADTPGFRFAAPGTLLVAIVGAIGVLIAA